MSHDIGFDHHTQMGPGPDEFQLVLPSTSSKEVFPDNSAASFTNLLPYAYTLHGEWEVGLRDIIIPGKLENINKGNNTFEIITAAPVQMHVPVETWISKYPAIKIEMDFGDGALITREQYYRHLWYCIVMQATGVANKTHSITRKGGPTGAVVVTTYMSNGNPILDKAAGDLEFSIASRPVNITFPSYHQRWMVPKPGIDPATGTKRAVPIWPDDQLSYDINFENGWSILFDSLDSKFQDTLMSLQSLTGISIDRYYRRIGTDGVTISIPTHFGLSPIPKFAVNKHYIWLVPPTLDYALTLDIQKNAHGNYFIHDKGMLAVVHFSEEIAECALTTGCYATSQDIIDSINELIPQVGWPKFSITKTGHLKIESPDDTYKAYFSYDSHLGKLLQIPNADRSFYLPKQGTTEYVTPNTINVTGDVTSLFVYCDLTETQTVGDSTSNLLRVIKAPGAESSQQTFDNEPYYISLNRNYFTKVTIAILDNLGHPAHFPAEQNSIVILHFKRVK